MAQPLVEKYWALGLGEFCGDLDPNQNKTAVTGTSVKPFSNYELRSLLLAFSTRRYANGEYYELFKTYHFPEQCA
ncbi:hypothetical protein [Nostoc sp.]|uniref:hypothetical protein n=1 Tax=Nostoc sp. TaxID=1180 RepID=UPI002FFC6050